MSFPYNLVMIQLYTLAHIYTVYIVLPPSPDPVSLSLAMNV